MFVLALAVPIAAAPPSVDTGERSVVWDCLIEQPNWLDRWLDQALD